MFTAILPQLTRSVTPLYLTVTLNSFSMPVVCVLYDNLENSKFPVLSLLFAHVRSGRIQRQSTVKQHRLFSDSWSDLCSKYNIQFK